MVGLEQLKPGRRAGVAALAAVITLTAGDALAAPRKPVPPRSAQTLTVSPAFIDAETSRSGLLPEISIASSSKTPFRLTARPALVEQALDGRLVIQRQPAAVALARRVLALELSTSVLGAHRTVTLRPTFRGYAGRRTITAAAVIEATPVGAKRAPYRLRFIATILVHRPQAAQRLPTLRGVSLVRAGARRLTLGVRVRNTAERAAAASRIRLRVLDSRGRALGGLDAQAGVVLPRSERRFTGTLFQRIRSGTTVRVEARVWFGKTVRVRQARLRVP